MTKTFSINENNDIYIGLDGNLSISSGIIATKYACENAAKTQKGELVLQTEQGIPNFQALWNGQPNISQFQAALSTELLSVSGVIKLLAVQVTVQNNSLNYIAVILTAYGQIQITGVLNGINV